MRDGLHRKLVGNGLDDVPQSLAVRSLVPSGKVPMASTPNGFDPLGNFNPFASTVIPAPSYAPIRAGSCKSCARFPLRLMSQPTTGSSGNRSTWNRIADEQLNVPDGSYGLVAPIGVPFSAKPNRQLTCRRQGSNLPAGCVFA